MSDIGTVNNRLIPGWGVSEKLSGLEDCEKDQRVRTFKFSKHFHKFLSGFSFPALFKKRQPVALDDPQGADKTGSPWGKSVDASEDSVEQLIASEQYAQAEPLALKVLKDREKTLDDTHPLIIEALYDLSVIYFSQQKFAETVVVSRRMVSLQEQIDDLDPADLAGSYAVLSAAYHGQHDYSAAIPPLEQAIDCLEKSSQPDEEALHYYSKRLAELYAFFGQYQKAVVVYDKILARDIPKFGEGHPAVAKTYQLKAAVYYELADYQTASDLASKASQIFSSTLGSTHEEVAKSRQVLGRALCQMGDLSTAESVLTSAHLIYRSRHSRTHYSVGLVCADLAEVYQAQGNHHEALLYSHNAYTVLYPVLEDFHSAPFEAKAHLARVLIGLSQIAFNLKSFDRAVYFARTSLELNREIFGDNHPKTGESHNSVAIAFAGLGDYQVVEEHAQQALAIYEQAFDEPHPEMAESLDLLASAHLFRNDHQAALVLSERASDITRQTYGESHQRHALQLGNLALAYYYNQDLANAKSALEQAIGITERNFESYFVALSAREQYDLVADRRVYLDLYLSMFPEDVYDLECYQIAFGFKGVASRSQTSLQPRRFASDENQQVYDELVDTRRQLAYYSYLAHDPHDAKKHQEEINGLTAKKEKLEEDLAAASLGYQKQKSWYGASVADVAQALPEDAVLVDFVYYRNLFADWGEEAQGSPYSYAAFVVKKEGDGLHVQRVDFGPEAPVHQAVTAYRQSFHVGFANQAQSRRADSIGAKVTELVWQPLSEVIGEADTVFVVPDAVMGSVSFAGLPVGDNEYLIREKTFGYLENARDLVRFSEAQRDSSRPRNSGALVIGGVDYSQTTTAAQGLAQEVNGVASCALPTEWRDLPHTLTEAQAVARTFSQNGEAVETFHGKSASERTFYEEAGGQRYIHLATHGFFAPGGACRSALDVHAQGIGYNPMLLSGVALAGDNGQDGSGDGILTAEEVASMDFEGTEVVVLSACETGLGNFAAGGEAQGLQRAFIHAGAESVVMSLWQLDDEYTQELMASFYQNLYNRSDLNQLEALRAAQIEILDQNLEQKGAGIASLWAGVVSSGDWE